LTGKPAMAVGGIGLNNWLQDTLKARNETASVDNLDEAAGFIERGEFDLLGVGRALINDPSWPERVRNREAFLDFDRTRLERLE
jgi:2,4-dienoyl-CoA reductase-like NADH-dependent reductase (Old Yellow Enzyme family)